MVEVIQKFYKSFSEMDFTGMGDCYHDEIEFEDPAFGKLKGKQVSNMWRMLCESQKGKEFIVTSTGIESNGRAGKAHWEAQYVFSKTGRKVLNKIDASFEFKDGKIIKHIDTFDLYKWSKQAMGMTGLLIGWTGFFKKRLNTQTNSMLRSFEKKLDTN